MLWLLQSQGAVDLLQTAMLQAAQMATAARRVRTCARQLVHTMQSQEEQGLIGHVAVMPQLVTSVLLGVTLLTLGIAVQSQQLQASLLALESAN